MTVRSMYSLWKFDGRHHELVNIYALSVSQMDLGSVICHVVICIRPFRLVYDMYTCMICIRVLYVYVYYMYTCIICIRV